VIKDFQGNPGYIIETEEDLAEQRQRQERLRDLRRRILAKAGDDLLEIKWAAGSQEDTYFTNGVKEVETWEAGSVLVPRAAFERWALCHHASLRPFAPEWEPVSHSGVKMSCDDPVHTDWWVGAGLDPDDYNRTTGEMRAFEEAVYDAWHEAEEKYCVFECNVLSEGPHALGDVVHPRPGETVPKGSIAIVPFASERYIDAAVTAAAIVTEAGGALSHIVVVGRERNLPIVRVKDALKKYPVGCRLSIDTGTGKLKAW